MSERGSSVSTLLPPRSPALSYTNPVAYFSMEFGTNPNSTYSGGLGVLSGDHLKGANDEGLPLVAVGLFYTHGYFRQSLTPDGYQIEQYPKIDPAEIGLETVKDSQGQELLIGVPIEDRVVKARVYLEKVGDVPLYLLSTNHPDNSPEDRLITGHLYGAAYPGETRTKIRQEIVLGAGGHNLLQALGITPSVYHMNEGHSAFLNMARIADLVNNRHLTVDEAIETVKANTLFTNHTLVPAGNDIFDANSISSELEYYINQLGSQFQQLRDRANHIPEHPFNSWSQPVFAKSTSAKVNAVSQRHADAARVAWNQAVVEYVTNGAHIGTWMDPRVMRLFDQDPKSFIKKHLEPGYVDQILHDTSNREIRGLRNQLRAELVAFANHYQDAFEPSRQPLDPNTLTLGWARRAATYKRLAAIIENPDQLSYILSNSDRPAQIVIAAKAHPQDEPGKEMIQRVVQTIAHHSGLRDRVIFIPDYNVDIAKLIVKGTDVWLNTPQVPLEASGTSGMKSSFNGGVQCSTRDGWMYEVPDRLYFPIEDDHNMGVFANHLYDTIEQIKQRFYGLDNKAAPSDEWINFLRQSMSYIIPRFSMSRVIRQYTKRLYLPLAKV